MNPFAFAGLVLAGCSVCAYVLLAWHKGKRPELNDAVVVFLGAGGVVSAVRMIGAVITGQFSKLTVLPASDSAWTLVPDDAVQIVLGGFALAWVSLQTILQIFIKLVGKPLATKVAHDQEAITRQISPMDVIQKKSNTRSGADRIRDPKT